MPLDYSCMKWRDLDLVVENSIVEARIERERPYM